MKFSLEQLQHACNELKNKNEIAIIEKYGRIGKNQTIAIMSKILYIYIYILNKLLITVNTQYIKLQWIKKI